MIQFAVNYAPETASLHRAGKIPLDRFKCPDWPEMIAEARCVAPVYIHFPLIVGVGTGEGIDGAIAEAVVRDVEAIAARFGPERVIVENDYGGKGAHPRAALLPEVIAQVVEETGVGFLFDLSHARLAAPQVGLGPCEYIARLPLHRLREMHPAVPCRHRHPVFR